MRDGTPPARLYRPSGTVLAVSLGVAAVPLPSGLGDVPDIIVAGRPAQLKDDLLWCCDQHRGIPRSATDGFMSDRAADDLLARAKHLEHSHAGSRAHVIGLAHARL